MTRTRSNTLTAKKVGEGYTFGREMNCGLGVKFGYVVRLQLWEKRQINWQSERIAACTPHWFVHDLRMVTSTNFFQRQVQSTRGSEQARVFSTLDTFMSGSGDRSEGTAANRGPSYPKNATPKHDLGPFLNLFYWLLEYQYATSTEIDCD